MNKPTAHKGKLSIFRWQGHSGTGISIELNDSMSNVRVVRIELTPEAFGNAATGLGYQEVEFELGSTDLVGCKHEYKTEMVPIEGWSWTDEQKLEAVKPFQTDGWVARLDDLGNHHRRTSNGYTVGFDRYVIPVTKNQP